MLSLNFSGLSDGIPEGVDPNTYGVDWSGPVPSCEDSEGVRVDDMPKIVGDADMSLLQSTINPMADSEDYGLDIFARVGEFVDAVIN